MKKVLITGASGFVGAQCMHDFSQKRWELIPLVRRSQGFKNEVIVDFCDTDFCRRVNSLPKVDAVVHLAAEILWGVNAKDQLFIPNVLATAELARWAKNIKAHFIFASTAIVCGGKNELITADSKPRPDCDYGYSKWLAEELIRFCGVNHTILRIAGIFGLNGPGHLGINRSISAALGGIVPVQKCQGSIKRNYIYVKDLCKIINYCIENKVEGTHLVAGSSINTFSQMLNLIAEILMENKKPRIEATESGKDQLVEHSGLLPKGRLFREAMEDIKHDYYKG